MAYLAKRHTYVLVVIGVLQPLTCMPEVGGFSKPVEACILYHIRPTKASLDGSDMATARGDVNSVARFYG